MGVYVRNTTGRRMFVLVFTIIYTPFPGGYYSGISLLSPGEGQAFHTFWGHASVLTWPSTGSAQADDRIANILRMVGAAVQRHIKFLPAAAVARNANRSSPPADRPPNILSP